MLRAIRLKFLFLFILTIIAIVFVLPSVTGGLPGWWEKHVSRGLNLGLGPEGGHAPDPAGGYGAGHRQCLEP